MSRNVDPDHHLWRNGRLFWVAFTIHLPGWRKERVRRSLQTADRLEARRRRDAVFSRWNEAGVGTLSLRFSPSRPGSAPALLRGEEERANRHTGPEGRGGNEPEQRAQA